MLRLGKDAGHARNQPQPDRSRAVSFGVAMALLAIAALAVGLPAHAQADVYEGRTEWTAPQQPPSFTPEPPIAQQTPFWHTFGVRYDSSAGTITLYLGIFNPEYWAPSAEEDEGGDDDFFPRFALASTCETAEDRAPQWGSEVDEAAGAYIGGQIGASAGDLWEYGYNGILSVPVIYANGVYTMTVTNSALSGLTAHCIAWNDSEWPAGALVLTDKTPHPTPAHPTSSRKTCDTAAFKTQSLRVEVSKGHASCSEARRVLRKLYTNQRGRAHGLHHNPPQTLEETYWLVDGWKCVVGAGGSACTRGRANQISGQWQG